MTDALYWMHGRMDTADIGVVCLFSGVSYIARGWVSEDDALENMERWRRNLKCSLRRLWHVFLVPRLRLIGGEQVVESERPSKLPTRVRYQQREQENADRSDSGTDVRHEGMMRVETRCLYVCRTPLDEIESGRTNVP